MALKSKITKDEYNKLSEAIKAEYFADGENFKLDLSDAEDTGALKRALEREKAAAGTSKTRVAELEAELESLNSNDARKKGDIATLEKQWQKKADETAAQFQARIDKLTAHVNTNLVDNVAMSLATKLSPKNAVVLMPHIKQRLLADFDGDTPSTKILGKDGKVSTLTIEQLQAEFIANKDFSGIIVASQASGGAGNGSKQNMAGGQNSQTTQNQQQAPLSKISPAALASQIKEQKAAAQQEA